MSNFSGGGFTKWMDVGSFCRNCWIVVNFTGRGRRLNWVVDFEGLVEGNFSVSYLGFERNRRNTLVRQERERETGLSHMAIGRSQHPLVHCCPLWAVKRRVLVVSGAPPHCECLGDTCLLTFYCNIGLHNHSHLPALYKKKTMMRSHSHWNWKLLVVKSTYFTQWTYDVVFIVCFIYCFWIYSV